MIAVNNIIRSVQRITDTSTNRFNVLTICRNNEKYINLLCQVPHNWYVLGNHPWNSLIAERPTNLFTLSSHSSPLDCIVCYDRAEQYEEAQNIASQFHIPIVLVDMCSQSLIRPHNIVETLQPRNPASLYRKPAVNISGSNNMHESWNKDTVCVVIPIGIDTNIYKPEQDLDEVLISIDNNVNSQVGAEISNRLAGYKILPTDHEDIATSITVNKTHYFINTQSTVTIKTLEAMAAANVVICMKNQDTETIIEHDKTGILIDNLDSLSPTVEYLEKSKDLKSKIGNAARKKVIAEHPLKDFISKWTNVFTMIKASFYIPSV